MFCHKCGTEIAEGAGFCHKCGTKVARVEEQVVPMQPATPTPVQPQPMPVQQSVPPVTATATMPVDDSAAFKEFVDNHVRTTTRFQSAEDLLKRKKTLLFLIPCFAIPAIIFCRGILLSEGSLMDVKSLLVAVLGTLLFGQGARYIVGTIIRSRCTIKTRGNFRDKIDPEDLCRFANQHLKYLEPYFHDWRFMPGRGYASTLGSDPEEVNIGSTFGSNLRCTAVICLRPDPQKRDIGEMQYLFAATKKEAKVPGILEWIVIWDFIQAFMVDESKHSCLLKSAPILQATMEYYLKYHVKNEGGNENVLH